VKQLNERESEKQGKRGRKRERMRVRMRERESDKTKRKGHGRGRGRRRRGLTSAKFSGIDGATRILIKDGEGFLELYCSVLQCGAVCCSASNVLQRDVACYQHGQSFLEECLAVCCRA